jgi:hypothetical protein
MSRATPSIVSRPLPTVAAIGRVAANSFSIHLSTAATSAELWITLLTSKLRNMLRVEIGGANRSGDTVDKHRLGVDHARCIQQDLGIQRRQVAQGNDRASAGSGGVDRDLASLRCRAFVG